MVFCFQGTDKIWQTIICLSGDKTDSMDHVKGDVDDDRKVADIDSIDEVNSDDGREGDGSPPLQLWIDAQ